MAHVFDRLSKTLQGKQAEIEVASLSLGDQVEAEWLLLHGITYDPNDDLVEVVLERLDHMIRKPRGGRAPFTEPRVALHYFGRSAGSDNRSCTALIRLGPPKAVDIDCVDARSATTRTEKFRLASSSQPTRK
jgi:Family of unknown function (DUF5335)